MLGALAQATPVGSGDELGYYEAAAQVIPTLFLAMVFQGRFFRLLGVNWVLRGTGAFVLLIIANAERTALNVLSNGDAGPGDHGTITGALVFMTGILVVSVVFDDKLTGLAEAMDRDSARSSTESDE